MKYAILSISFLIGSFAFAQDKKLTGPAYKNAHPSVKYDSNNTVVVAEKPSPLTGPAFKNQKPWDKKNVTTKKVSFIKKKPLKGPKAKNAKPWDN